MIPGWITVRQMRCKAKALRMEYPQFSLTDRGECADPLHTAPRVNVCVEPLALTSPLWRNTNFTSLDLLSVHQHWWKKTPLTVERVWEEYNNTFWVIKSVRRFINNGLNMISGFNFPQYETCADMHISYWLKVGGSACYTEQYYSPLKGKTFRKPIHFKVSHELMRK